jgi:hypothetical protein
LVPVIEAAGQPAEETLRFAAAPFIYHAIPSYAHMNAATVRCRTLRFEIGQKAVGLYPARAAANSYTRFTASVEGIQGSS